MWAEPESPSLGAQGARVREEAKVIRNLVRRTDAIAAARFAAE